MPVVRIVIIFMVFGTLGMTYGQGYDQKRKLRGSVTFNIVDEHGQAIPYTLSELSAGWLTPSYDNLKSTPNTTLTATNLAPGNYNYILKAIDGTSFENIEGRLTIVDAEDRWITRVARRRSNVPDRSSSVDLYSGVVSPVPDRSPAWVTLISMYEGSVVEESRLDEKGRFRFVNHPVGRFIVVTNAADKVLDVRFIELFLDTRYPFEISIRK